MIVDIVETRFPVRFLQHDFVPQIEVIPHFEMSILKVVSRLFRKLSVFRISIFMQHFNRGLLTKFVKVARKPLKIHDTLSNT